MTRIQQVLKDIPFLIHLAVYAGVNLLLFIINMLTNPGTIWFVWPLVGWGIGVLGHGILVYLNAKAPKAEQVQRADAHPRSAYESLAGRTLMTRIQQVLKDIPFLIHLAVYAGVNLLLFIINMLTNSGTIWFVWPLVGWGIGVLGHGILVYLNAKAPPAPQP